MRISSVVVISLSLVFHVVFGGIVTEENPYYGIVEECFSDSRPPMQFMGDVQEGDSAEECIRKVLVSWRRESLAPEEMLEGDGPEHTLRRLEAAYQMHPDNLFIKVLYGRIGFTPIGCYKKERYHFREPSGHISSFIAVMAPLLQEADDMPYITYLFLEMMEYVESSLPSIEEGASLEVSEFAALFGVTGKADNGNIGLLKDYWLSKTSPSCYLALRPDGEGALENARAYVARDGNLDKALELWSIAMVWANHKYNEETSGKDQQAIEVDEAIGEKTGNMPAANHNNDNAQEVFRKKILDGMFARLENPEFDFGDIRQLSGQVLQFKGFKKELEGCKELPNIGHLREVHGERDAAALNIYFKAVLMGDEDADREELLADIDGIEWVNDDYRLLLIKRRLMSILKRPAEDIEKVGLRLEELRRQQGERKPE